jgi:hypothetical protein
LQIFTHLCHRIKYGTPHPNLSSLLARLIAFLPAATRVSLGHLSPPHPPYVAGFSSAHLSSSIPPPHPVLKHLIMDLAHGIATISLLSIGQPPPPLRCRGLRPAPNRGWRARQEVGGRWLIGRRDWQATMASQSGEPIAMLPHPPHGQSMPIAR